MTYCNSHKCKKRNKCKIHVFNAPEGNIYVKDLSTAKCEYRKEDTIRKTTDLERWKLIKDMRDRQGLRFRVIANELGVSRQRVQYIYNRIKKLNMTFDDY